MGLIIIIFAFAAFVVTFIVSMICLSNVKLDEKDLEEKHGCGANVMMSIVFGVVAAVITGWLFAKSVLQ